MIALHTILDENMAGWQPAVLWPSLSLGVASPLRRMARASGGTV